MAICPCDQTASDACLDIPPGLHALPRQSRGFGEVKARLMASVATQPALKGWTGEAEQDLGVMLLDMWSYVMDITQFYDAQITQEFYLGTANQDLSTHRIIKLLGYSPAPPMAAEATLIAEANTGEQVIVPAKSGFRSDAFDDEAPHIFQTIAAQTLDPARNRWQLGPITSDLFPDRVLLRPEENGVPKRGVLAFALEDVAYHASQIAGRRTYLGADDRKMAEVLLEDPLSFEADVLLDSIKMRLMGLRAGASPLDPTFEAGTLFLDTLYPQLRAGELAVLETENALVPFLIESTIRTTLEITLDTGAKIPVPVSKVVMGPTPGFTLEAATKWRLHFNPVRVGRLRAPYKTEVVLDDIADGSELLPPRFPQDETLSGAFMLQGAAGAGAEVSGDVTRDARRREVAFGPAVGQDSFMHPMQTPVHLFGNLIKTVRTEQVSDEVLGSADASQTSQRFKLKKAPLTWITDASQSTGRRPLIEVRVDGVLWHRVETFYTAVADDRVYGLERDAKGDTWVVFGDGDRGALPMTGVANVTASYGHGAGAAAPPPRAITQTARPIKGLGRVMNPLACKGGADAEDAKDIRLNAPATVLTLGRAVSMQDFTALAWGFNGVINVAAAWAWHQKRQRAVVTVWVVGDGSLDLVALRAWLENKAATETPLSVEHAVAVPKSLALSIDMRPDHPKEETLAAVLSALEDPVAGLLAPANVAIGGVLYRSDIVKAAQTVPGVQAVPAVLLNGIAMDWAHNVSAGTHADFSNAITVT